MCRRGLCQFFCLLLIHFASYAMETDDISYSDTNASAKYYLHEIKDAVATIHKLAEQRQSIRLVIDGKSLIVHKYFDKAKEVSLYIETDIWREVIDELMDLLNPQIEICFTLLPSAKLFLEDVWLKKIFVKNWRSFAIKGPFDFSENIFASTILPNQKVGVIAFHNKYAQSFRITKNDISYFLYHISDPNVAFRPDLLLAASAIPFLETIILRGRADLPEDILRQLSTRASHIKLPISDLRKIQGSLSHFKDIHIIDDEKLQFTCADRPPSTEEMIFRVNDLSMLNDEEWKIIESLPVKTFACIEALNASHAQRLNQCKSLRAIRATRLTNVDLSSIESVELESFDKDTLSILYNMPNLYEVIINCQDDDIPDLDFYMDQFVEFARSKKLKRASKTTIFGREGLFIATISFGTINHAVIAVAKEDQGCRENCLHWLSCIDSDITDEALEILGNFPGLYSLNLSGSQHFSVKGLELVMKNPSLQALVLPLHLVDDIPNLLKLSPHIAISVGDA